MSNDDVLRTINSLQRRILDLENDRDSMHKKIYNIELEICDYKMPIHDWFEKVKQTGLFMASEEKGDAIAQVIKDVNTYFYKNHYQELVTEDLYQIILKMYTKHMDNARQQRALPFDPHVVQYFIRNLRDIDPKLFRQYGIYR